MPAAEQNQLPVMNNGITDLESTMQNERINKDDLIRFRCEVEEKSMVIKAAMLKGYKDVSPYLRELVVKEAKRVVEEFDKKRSA